MPAVLATSSAPNTVRQYSQAFERWKGWSEAKGFTALPARPAQFLLYWFSAANSAQTYGPGTSSLYGTQWMHNICGVSPPTTDSINQNCFHGLRRLLATTAKKKKPLLSEHIKQIIDGFAQPGGSLADLQIASLMSLGFAGFLRWDKLHRLRQQDLHFHPRHTAVFIESRKSDQFREGHWVFIANLDSRYCPMQLLRRFPEVGRHTPNDPLFRKVTRHPASGSEYFRDEMTYSRARERAAEVIAAIGLKPKEYGLHSLRSGGATQAARAGVPDRLFQRHGGWHSGTSRNRYIEESLRNLLSVSRSLHL